MAIDQIASYPISSYKPLSGPASDETQKKQENGNIEASQVEKLSEEDKKTVNDLKKRDQEVRSHEMAHVAAGGQYVKGGPSFDYKTGPDGKRYAVGGEVGIDTSAVKGDPEATIQKMRVIAKAALAPAQPSAQDRSIAASAAQKEAKASLELQRERPEAGENAASDAKSPDKTGSRQISYTRSGIAVPADPNAQDNILDLIA